MLIFNLILMNTLFSLIMIKINPARVGLTNFGQLKRIRPQILDPMPLSLTQ